MSDPTLEPSTSPGEISQWPMLKIVYRTDPVKIAELLPPGIDNSDTSNVTLTIYNLPVNEEPEYGHHRMWVDACKAGFGSEEHLALTSSFDYAGPMTETVLMGNLAIRSYMLRQPDSNGEMQFFGRRKLIWDGESMRITNLEEANQFVGRTYREGWEM